MSRCECVTCSAPAPECEHCPPGSAHHTPLKDWWRFEVSDLGDGVYVSGAPTTQTAAHAVDGWAALGVTRVIDLTEYGFVESLPVAVASELSVPGVRQWLQMFDPCLRPPDGLIAAAVALAGEHTTLVHCHMGVNRAPSVAFAVLLARGVGVEEALERVLARRPVAAARYVSFALAERLGCDLDDPRIDQLEAQRHALIDRYRSRLLAGEPWPEAWAENHP